MDEQWDLPVFKNWSPSPFSTGKTRHVPLPELVMGYILSRKFGDQTVYVSHKPGDGGVDWGYTHKPQGAVTMPKYWKRRFLSDMRKVNARGVSAFETPDP